MEFSFVYFFLLYYVLVKFRRLVVKSKNCPVTLFCKSKRLFHTQFTIFPILGCINHTLSSTYTLPAFSHNMYTHIH